jgi:hypothetical protein
MSAFTSEIGTFETSRPMLPKSVQRVRPEVLGRGAKRREWPSAETDVLTMLCITNADIVSGSPGYMSNGICV